MSVVIRLQPIKLIASDITYKFWLVIGTVLLCVTSGCAMLSFLCSILLNIVCPFYIFFFWPLYCLSYFDLQLLITPLSLASSGMVVIVLASSGMVVIVLASSGMVVIVLASSGMVVIVLAASGK
jgi:hypothetical protein